MILAQQTDEGNKGISALRLEEKDGEIILYAGVHRFVLTYDQADELFFELNRLVPLKRDRR